MTRVLLPAALVVAVSLGTGLSCRTRADLCSDPVAVARAFVDAVETGDADGALALLSRASRDRLDRSAGAASATLGQKVRAADLLIPERSLLARSEWLSLRSVSGDEAQVEVRPPPDVGAAENGPWGVQRLVREDGCWKIALF